MPTYDTPAAETLGDALKQARMDAYAPRTHGSLTDLARRIGVSHNTLSQWESNKRDPGPDNVKRILDELGIEGARFEMIMAIARAVKEKNWLTGGATGIDEKLTGIMQFERTCTELAAWTPLNMPALLQTGEFATAVVRASRLPDPEVEARVTLRVGRRRALTRRNAPEMLALIGEGAVRSMTGGPEVMKDQLDMLLKLERELPNLRIKVVPLGTDYHDGSNGPFHLYRFANRTPIVYCEHLRGSVFITERFDVEAYESTVNELMKLAMDDKPEQSDKSLAFIASIRDSL